MATRHLSLRSVVLALVAVAAAQTQVGMVLAQEGVCARVKLELLQHATLERQAFDAHMRITNALTDTPLTEVGVTVLFTDKDGAAVVASSDPADTAAKFFVTVDTMTGIDGVGGQGSVAPVSVADAHWLVVPAPGAGLSVSAGTLYYVGARLTYAVGGVAHQTDVAPDFIYVKPMPDLVLDYFLPREVIGDDAWTPAVEAAVPFSLGLRVKNSGGGVAKSFAIESAQPKITENQQGLLIGFVLTGCEIDGQPSAPTLLANLGDIAPGASGMARWSMECSLSGEFVEFTASFTHADELGGAMTSLVQAVNTHTLVHDVLVDSPGHDAVRDFLAIDGGAYQVFESSGLDTPVIDVSLQASLSLVDRVGTKARYQLTAPASALFTVAKLPDPEGGLKALASVVRSDGKRVVADDAWLGAERGEAHAWNHFLYLFDVGSTGSYVLTFDDASTLPQAPVLQPIPDQVAVEGRRCTFVVQASAPDGTTPSLSASPLPAGARFSDQGNGTGVFDWTPALGQAGTYDVAFVAAEGAFTTSRHARILVRLASDTDGDGLSDAWELEHFATLDREGSGDLDGDGFSDLQEYQLGLDPARRDGATWTLATTSAGDQWQHVALAESYSHPVVIAGPASSAETAPGVIAVAQVTRNAFDVRFQEWEYLDGPHAPEQIPYLVVGAGRSALPDGTLVEAGTLELSEAGTWTAASFSAPFTGTPTLLLTVQTGTEAPALSVRARSVTTAGFEVGMFQEGVAATAHGTATIGYLAIVPGSGAGGTASVNGADQAYSLLRQSVDWRWVKALGPRALCMQDEESLVAGGQHGPETVAGLVVDGTLLAQDVSGTDPATSALRASFADVDADRMNDDWERLWFGDLARDGTLDFDQDALSDLAEYDARTDPTRSDSDGDLLPDGWEVVHCTEPLSDDAVADPDGDGFSNLEEYRHEWDPQLRAPQVLEVQAVPTTGSAPLDVSFTCVTTGVVTTLAWSFGDGSQGQGLAVTHRYVEPGTFQAAVEAAGPGGVTSGAVAIEVENAPPVAKAGPDLEAAARTVVRLDGSASSDANDGISTWSWQQTAGQTVALTEADGPVASFTAPDVGREGAVLSFLLMVSDHFGAQAEDDVSVSVQFVNHPPLADAGPAQTVLAGSAVALDGSGSSDQDGPLVTWSWVQTSGPPVALRGADGPVASFVAPVVPYEGATLGFRLSVGDLDGATDTADVVVAVRWVNQAPVAIAGPDQWVGHGQLVLLSGFGSYDPDGAVVQYDWTQTSGLPVPLSGAGTAVATFYAPLVPLPGATLGFQLSVTDTFGATSAAAMTVYVTGVNLPPVAEAGPSQTVTCGEVVTLNGLNSYDPDDAIVAYGWAETSGPPVVLSAADAAIATFVAPTVPWPGTAMGFSLTVRDTFGLTGTDSVALNVTAPDQPPVAEAGPDQTVSFDQLVQLDGLASHDPDDGLASFSWRQVGGSPLVMLSEPTGSRPTFRFPSAQPQDLSLTFELTVADHFGLHDSDEVLVSASAGGHAPVADAGPDQAVLEGATVRLDGLGSRDQDPGDGIMAYEWRQVAGPPVVLSATTTATPTFVSPPVAKDATITCGFELSVRDRTGLLGTDSVEVAIRDNGIPQVPVSALPFFAYNGKHLSVEVAGDAALISLYARAPEVVTDQVNRPLRLLVGLVELQIKVGVPGASVQLTFYLQNPAPKPGDWYTWDERSGWQACDGFAWFDPERKKVVLTLVDGGQGDGDGQADGFVTMLGGPGSPPKTKH